MGAASLLRYRPDRQLPVLAYVLSATLLLAMVLLASAAIGAATTADASVADGFVTPFRWQSKGHMG